jgi:putative hydrolase of the HAD superfamily
MDDAGLAALIRRHSPPLLPLPVPQALPSAAASAFPRGGFRAYIFDVYGTLFVSASGDISLFKAGAAGNELPAASSGRRGDAGSGENPEMIQELLAPFGEGAGIRGLVNRFTSAVQAEHKKLRRSAGVPEIRVEKIWAGILGVDEKTARDFALRFELSVNPVYPMPGLADMLGRLGAAGVPLGIVSNAQFFTPLLFTAFLEKPPESLGFLPNLCVYSFREGEAKPSSRLFRRAAGELENLRIRPADTLYIGNDMLNDVWAAKEAGFTAALFAGDDRSLRLRRKDSRCADLKPDFVLQSLDEIPITK